MFFSKKLVTFGIIILFSSFLARDLSHANQPRNALSAANLVKACMTPEQAWISFCDGYLQAAVDLLEIQKVPVCIPQGYARNKIFEDILPNIQKSSSDHNTVALVMLYNAILGRFKCQ